MSASSQLVQIDLGHAVRSPKPSWLKAKAPVGDNFHNLKKLARYKEIVLGGELKDRGMASFADLLKPEAVEAIHAYVLMTNHVHLLRCDCG